MNIYFAGSIRGGRSDAGLYRELIAHLQTFGTVLTEHIGHDGLSPEGETSKSDREIHDRDLDWLTMADVVVAEVTNPSLGVGYEIAKASCMNKKILCLFRPRGGSRLSAMIAGCPGVAIGEYQEAHEARKIMDRYFLPLSLKGAENGSSNAGYAADISFEPLSARNGQEVMNIFNYFIENSFAAYPDKVLPGSFFDRLLEMTRGYPAYTIQRAGKTVGFCFLRAYSPHSTFSATAEITYFIHPDHTGQGLGSMALMRLEGDARLMGIQVILASISSINGQSLAFHRRHGFRECGRFGAIGIKRGQPFDVVWMQKEIRI
jgi:phosphinothricin acetyltransferase